LGLTNEILNKKNKLVDSHWTVIPHQITGATGREEKIVQDRVLISNEESKIRDGMDGLHRLYKKPKNVNYYHAVIVFAKDSMPNFMFKGRVLAKLKK